MRFDEGIAGASSIFNPSKYGDRFGAANGFSRDPAVFWASANESADRSGSGSGSAGLASNPFLALIWFDFRAESYAPTKVSFKPHQPESGYADESAKMWTPTRWQFVGSNDETCAGNGTWTTLCEDVSGAPIAARDEKRGCKVKAEPTTMAVAKTTTTTTTTRVYRCLGIRILETPDGNYAALHGIRIWAQKPGPPAEGGALKTSEAAATSGSAPDFD